MKHFKSLAIIGSSGMIGSDLVDYLKSNFDTVTGIDRKNYAKYIGKKFDVVINANGNSNKRWAKDHPLLDFAASTMSVYQSLFDFFCKIYIYVSSADVYPDHTSVKTTNESTIINSETLTSYGFHKYLSELIVRNFTNAKRLQTPLTKNHLILRCPMMLGANLKKGPVYDLLNKAHLFINPSSSFQMLTTKELARIITSLLDQNITNETFNVGGRETVRLNAIMPEVKKPVALLKDNETHIYETNVSKLQEIYNLKTSAQYLKSFLKNYIILKS